MGLLINSSDLVSEEDVYVATGVESTSMMNQCDLLGCQSWISYTSFKPFSADKAAGDIFIRTKDGTLVMAITGVQFTKLLITKLEQFLNSANPKSAKETTPKDRNFPKLIHCRLSHRPLAIRAPCLGLVARLSSKVRAEQLLQRRPMILIKRI